MNYFIYVVCGGAEYINQLNFSLKYLRYFSKFPIIVATDISRNKIAIEHTNILNVETPKEYTNNEASIYIETSLHKHLDIANNTYCYIDSDMIAINADINEIFNLFIPPIAFVKDHCTFEQHSPHAYNCNCFAERKDLDVKFKRMLNELPKISKDRNAKNDIELFNRILGNIKEKPLRNIFSGIHFLMSRYFSNKITFCNSNFNNIDKTWRNKSNLIISYDFKSYNKLFKKKYEISFDTAKMDWFTNENKIASPIVPTCNHSTKYIENTYGLSVPKACRHWNGGLFVFNKLSVEVMDYWHEISVESFNNPLLVTKYIDQITMLVATLKYKLNLENTIPIKFNFICDKGHPGTKYDEKIGYTYNNFKSNFKPAFLHIYHHWGDEKWDIWQSILQLAKKNNIIN